MKTVVLGSSIKGIAHAIALRSCGEEVCLIAPSTYLGEDLTATWAGYGVISEKNALAYLKENGIALPAPLLPGRLKRELTKRLLDAGVDVRYMSRPAGIQVQNGKTAGVLIGGKHGLYWEKCDNLLDASLYSVAQKAILGQPVLVPAGAEVSVRLEYRGIPDLENRLLLPNVSLERGALDDEHAYLTVKHTFEQTLSMQEARGHLWQIALNTALQLGNDVRFPRLELTNALGRDEDYAHNLSNKQTFSKASLQAIL